MNIKLLFIFEYRREVSVEIFHYSELDKNFMIKIQKEMNSDEAII
jgi:hypothetical protein